MPDITMCEDKECPLRNECYRYRAIPNEFRQYYFCESPRQNDDCIEFYKIPDRARIKDIKEEDKDEKRI